MRGLSTKLWASIDERTVFLSYRLLAWLLAALLIAAEPKLFGVQGTALLVIAGALSTALTVWSHTYLRVARRRPLVLVCDVVLSVALVVASGGLASPFQFYSYSALILPALLWSRVGGVLCAAFVIAGNFAVFGFPPPNAMPLAAQVRLGFLLAIPMVLVLVLPLLFRSLRSQQAHRGVGVGSAQRLGQQPQLREEHDGVLQQLSIGGRIPGRNPASVVADAPVVAPPVPLRTASNQGRQHMRHTVFGPSPGSDVAIDHAIDQLVQSFSRFSSISASLTVLGTPIPLKPVAYNTLVRLTQEALLNVEQHAHAAQALVTLRCDAQRMVLTIEDDGVGLLDGTYERPGLHALRAVNYRLAEVGGILDVQEREHNGLIVQATVPLNSGTLRD